MTASNSLNISQAGVVSFDGTATFTGSVLTQHDVLVGGTSNAVVSVTPGTAGLVLTSNGVSSDPSFQSVSAAGGITQVNGDTGSVIPTSGVITLTAGTTGFSFTGSGSTMTMSSPELNLPDTSSSSVGVINVNSNPFMHKFGDANNVFVGTNAGNFTMTSSIANTALGSGALSGLTTGDNNVAIGNLSANAITTSSNVISIGKSAMALATTASGSTVAIGTSAIGAVTTGNATNSVVIGHTACQNFTSCQSNVYIGSLSGSTGVGTGANNVGVGVNTLKAITSGSLNVAIGAGAMSTGVLTGSSNVSIGVNNLSATTSGAGNVSIGQSSMNANTTGQSNTVVGNNSMINVAGAANFNIILGDTVGNAYTTTESSNILINGGSVIGESNTLRIGVGTGTGNRQLNAAFIFGIFGKTVGVSGIPVVVDNTGQFGTVVSSLKFKENIENISDITSRIRMLRPVVFNYKGKSDKEKCYGLIAEEVNEIFPELVVRDLEGDILSIKYQELPILLLKELQKALKRIEFLESKICVDQK